LAGRINAGLYFSISTAIRAWVISPDPMRFNITTAFAPARGGENQIKCAAFVDGRVFNFANQYGQAQSEQKASR